MSDSATFTGSSSPQQQGSLLRAWMVCVTAALFFFYEFIQMNIINSLGSPLIHAFHVDAGSLGGLASLFFYGNTLLLIPAGVLLDRCSTRRAILWALFSTTVGVALMAQAQQFVVAEAARFLQGASNAFCFLACLRLASRWLPPRQMALGSGVIVTIAMMGGVVAQNPMVWLNAHYGWRNSLWFDVALGALIWALIALLVRDEPSQATPKTTDSAESSSAPDLVLGLRTAVSNRQNWFAGLYTGLLNLPLALLGGLWGSMYLVRAFQLTATQAAAVTSMIFIGTIFGSPLAGAISDRLQRRRAPMIAGVVLSLAVILGVLYGSHWSQSALMVGFFLLGLVTSAQVVSYPLIAESNPPEMTSTAMGVASCLIMGSGAVFQSISGALLRHHWQGQLVHGDPFYTLADYRYALTIMPLMFVVALLFALGLRETRAKPYGSNSLA